MKADIEQQHSICVTRRRNITGHSCW